MLDQSTSSNQEKKFTTIKNGSHRVAVVKRTRLHPRSCVNREEQMDSPDEVILL